ncbi:cytochrome P450 [Aspergillus pseudoustus]|uniref:Cytochrome P450 n=1 Tax=Aspergillus pseudoustus TaxID=1810923 RepID=A0ABR4KCZ4_9EURO
MAIINYFSTLIPPLPYALPPAVAKHPGPFLACASSLWGFYLNLQGRRAHEIVKAHQRYGRVVRVAPNLLSFSNPQAVREIYMNPNFTKSSRFYIAKHIFNEDMLLTFRDPHRHRQRRKLLSRGFSQAALVEFEPQIADKINLLLRHWGRLAQENNPIDVYPWAHMLGFDIIYHLMFGIDPQSVKTGKESKVMPWLRAWRPTFNYKEMVPPLGQYGPYIPGRVGSYFRLVQKWKNYAMDIVRDCRETGTKTPFLSRVLGGVDESLGRPLTDSELAEECMGGMFGGSGTTANTFVYALWGIIRDASIVNRLREELDEAFPDPDIVPDSVTCAQLPFLNAVLSETLRRYPTITGLLPREAQEDVIVDGICIPKGANVATGNLTVHLDETSFPDPLTFNPDRWLASDAPRDALVPFSVGARKCIGMNLAELELRVWLAAFFKRFDARLDKSMTENDMDIYDSFSASPRGGRLLVWLEKRRR